MIVGDCCVCCKELADGDEVYAISSGSMSKELYDFVPSESTPWEVFCPDCMNRIDLLIHTMKIERNDDESVPVL